MTRAWAILLGSAVLEAVWANALSASEGFTRLWPSVLFVVATVLSTVGLAIAMKSIPTGTAYAVWTSVGTVLTVAYSVSTGAEEISWVKVLLLVGIVGCVVGLKILDAPARQAGSSGSGSAVVG
ncbi:DMT family transporter [Tessaracoccus oleiagri]|uniref:Quaternary ammonium compound-resistance protein SugE n=1 Tax=Tessaracoccus oleiagri TaxID=686624 RepID=A0A1G9I662_9ACTN|nr:multidrug efflux SMR transporter [Tessaracoccus oleiagri]SDL20711.1 quaternary ammonium compound-resistance protein SugE [Tessaracoccus oleiagri]